MKKVCFTCNKKFEVPNHRSKTAHYCSVDCYRKSGTFKNSGRTQFKRGVVAEENNSQWKGINASYSAIHKWVNRKLGKACRCEKCGVLNMKYHWANKSGRYYRDLADYFQLCVSCHKKYDLERLANA